MQLLKRASAQHNTQLAAPVHATGRTLSLLLRLPPSQLLLLLLLPRRLALFLLPLLLLLAGITYPCRQHRSSEPSQHNFLQKGWDHFCVDSPPC